ncbi:E3 ubiquitin-protein ligase E3D-like [Actinia tenebrosa]|uniref:E3 ubiquitin-protein ligase E3D n=1 Tax=Actinia tenebrosa TaxID=6105 RepID=A0A6P8ISU2_ACTTE|nr:E3 ubiquitin-protein ligase E3D-like [Actinia tenebrosa]
MADEAVLVWCDVRKNIGVLQFILGLREPGKADNNNPECINAEAVEITVKRDGVVVKKNEELNGQSSKGKKATKSSKQCRILFQDVIIDPLSCNGLSLVQDKELQMRLRISIDDSSSVPNIFSQTNEYDVQLDEERQGLKRRPVEMRCKMCLDSITENMQFDRVLELPSELWQQTSLNLCCHGTVTNLPSLQEGSLNPAETDCLLGSYFILLHVNAFKSKHLDSMGSRVIKCHRCGWSIGDLVLQHDGSSEFQVKCVRINKHAVTTSLGVDNIFREYTTELYLSRLLLSKLQGRVNFKFLVKSAREKETRQSCAILWILNSNAAVLTNVPNKYIDGCIIDKSNENSKEMKAKLMKGVKILYKVFLSSTDEEIKILPGRSTMETLDLPQEEFFQLVLLLTSSTHTMPPSQRKVDEFTVGYLKT